MCFTSAYLSQCPQWLVSRTQGYSSHSSVLPWMHCHLKVIASLFNARVFGVTLYCMRIGGSSTEKSYQDEIYTLCRSDPDKCRFPWYSPDSRSSYRGCNMIGSGNMPFPCNMTLWHPWQSIDDPHWSLTTLTRDPQGSKQPVPAVTRENAPVSVVWDAVMGCLSLAGGHEILKAHSAGFTLPDMAQKTDTLSLLSLRNDLAADITM